MALTSLRTAKDYMAHDLVVAKPDMEVSDAILLLLKHEVSGMPVADESGKLVGILSESDCVATFAQAQYHEMRTALVKDLMSTDILSVEPDTDILKVAQLFCKNRYRRFPVLDQGKLVGQISRRDVLRAILDIPTPHKE